MRKRIAICGHSKALLVSCGHWARIGTYQDRLAWRYASGVAVTCREVGSEERYAFNLAVERNRIAVPWVTLAGKLGRSAGRCYVLQMLAG